jgi:hypothetical protein
LESTAFKVISITETALILGIYTATMLWVLYHVGKSLEYTSYLTIGVFFFSELISLIIYVANAFITDQSTDGIPDEVA